MSPDRGHFHHRLIDMGLSQKQAVAILYSISAVLGLSAVVITTSGEMKALILIVAFCVAMGVATIVFRKGRVHEHKNGNTPAEEPEAAPKKTEDTSAGDSKKD